MSDARRILFEQTETLTSAAPPTPALRNNQLDKKQLLNEIRKLTTEQVEHQTNAMPFVQEQTLAEKESFEQLNTEQFANEEKEIAQTEYEEAEQHIDVSEALQQDMQNISVAYPETQTQKKKSLLFRVKIITVAFILCTSLLGGVSVYNAVELNNLSQAVQTARQTDFQVKLEKLILKIIGADGAQEKVESVIDSHPTPLQDVASLSAPSNWWSKVCNAISSFFGGGID